MTQHNAFRIPRSRIRLCDGYKLETDTSFYLHTYTRGNQTVASVFVEDSRGGIKQLFGDFTVGPTNVLNPDTIERHTKLSISNGFVTEEKVRFQIWVPLSISRRDGVTIDRSVTHVTTWHPMDLLGIFVPGSGAHAHEIPAALISAMHEHMAFVD